MPEKDPSNPVQIIVAPELAEILEARRADRNELSIAAGHGPLTDQSPFISSADVEKERARAAVSPNPRGRITHAARAKIVARSQSNPAFERHARKCSVCRHPEVDRIEGFFINWSSAPAICKVFKITGVDAIYRHASATGLDLARRQNARFAIEKIIEGVDRVTVTSSSVIRAVRALSRIDDKGKWTDPPSTHILVRGTDAAPSVSGAPEQGIASDSSTDAVSNRLIYEELEVDVTHTKGEADIDSNR